MAELTGRRVFTITASAFAVIICANVALVVAAIRTFPGIEVGNSYVASQSFEADRAAQQALGWTLTPAYADGRLTLSFTDRDGYPAPVADLAVLVGRSTQASDDSTPAFIAEGGLFAAPLTLAPGKWMLRVDATAPDGTRFHQRLDLFVKAPA